MKGAQLSRHSFGQPLGGVIQVAYVVEDIERSMRQFSARLKNGPWFVSGPFKPSQAQYRGRATELSLTLAVGFAGHMSFELIEQHDTVPSVFRETIEARGYGFHHWAVASEAFDDDVERYRSLGDEIAFSVRSSRVYRIAYVDTTRELPGVIELIELTTGFEERYAKMHQASLAWDGTEPVRRVS